MKKVLFTLSVFLIYSFSFGQTIKLGNFKDTLCAGESLTLSITVTSGPLNNGNFFYLILSSNTGVFNTVDTIGSKAGKTSTTITATIKNGTIAGTAYRIRLVASQHSAIADTTLSKTINAILGNNILSSISATTCSGTIPNPLSGSTPTGGGGSASYIYTWQSSTTSGTAGFGGTIGSLKDYSPTSLTLNTWYRRIVTSGPCSKKDTSSSFKITVIPLPTANITGNISVCQNAASPTITLAGSGGTAPYTFTYHIDAGSDVSTNATTITASTASTGTFTYYLTKVQDALCFQTLNKTVAVNVNPLPTASITGTTTVCQNSTAPLITFIGSGGTAPYTFAYTKNGVSNTTSSSTVNASTSTPGTFTYILTGVTEGSSSACSQAQSDTVIIIVRPLPTATIAGTVSVCQNDTLPNIIFTGVGGIAPYTFTYHINSSPNLTIKTKSGNKDTIKASTSIAGTFTYFLTNIQDSFCSQTQAKNVIVTVNPAPDMSSNITSKTICSGESTNLTLIANPTSSFTWVTGTVTGGISGATADAGNIIDQVLINPSHSVPGNVVYNITSASSIGNCKAKFSTTVTVNPKPLPPIIKTSLFSGSSICKLTSNMNFETDSISQQTYQWLNSGVGVKINKGKKQHNSIISFPNEGNAIIWCKTTLTINSVSCSDSTIKNYVVTPNTNNLCSEIAVKPNKSGLVSLNNDVGSYEWGYDNKQTNSLVARGLGTNQDYNPSPMPPAQDRSYWVMVNDNINGTCFSKSYYGENCLTSNLQNITPESPQIEFFPNPVSTSGHIVFDSQMIGHAEIFIYDAFGKLIFSDQKEIEGQKEIDLDFKGLSTGVYFIKVYTNQLVYKSFKVIKM